MEILTQKEILQAKEIIKQVKRIAVVSHYNPDGDAVGSSLAFYNFFKARNIDITVILPNALPDFLSWMPGSEHIIIAEENKKKATEIITEVDLLFVVDMNAPHRSGPLLENVITQTKAKKILIDHHLYPDIEVDISLSTQQTSSSSELVYDFLFSMLPYENELTKEIAECIYVGIITDTGSLSYLCNFSKTYLTLAKIIECGVDGEQIHRNIYNNYSEARIRLLGLTLCDRLTIIPEFSTSYMYLTKKDLQRCDYKRGDTEGFVNYGLTMKSVRFTAFFIERDNRVRISFRSKGNFDVNLFARTHFGGGGHRNASAAYYDGNLEDTIAYFKEVLKVYKNELKP